MREHEINKLDNFIAGWYLDNTKFCDDIIKYHKDSPNKIKGLSKLSANSIQKSPNSDSTFKKSTDVAFERCEELNSYYKVLQRCVEQYIKKYPYCNKYGPWTVTENPIIQYYRPGEGYYEWHAERISAHPMINNRHLVFMTYLNDVTDKGGTEFFHQKITTKAEKGLTLLWPADWTFTHRSEISDTEEKYIVTGWLEYYNREE